MRFEASSTVKGLDGCYIKLCLSCFRVLIPKAAVFF